MAWGLRHGASGLFGKYAANWFSRFVIRTLLPALVLRI